MIEKIPEINFIVKMSNLKDKGFVPALRKGNTGIGFTLETHLGIRENNYAKGDFIDNNTYKGILFELKSQRFLKKDPRKKKTLKNSHLISLVTQAPHNGMSNRELLKKFGNPDSKGRNRKNLYATITAGKRIRSKYDSISKMEIQREGSILHLIVDGEKVANVDLSKILSKLENLVIVRADSDWRECSCENTDLHDKEGFHEYFHFNQPIIFRKFNKEKFYEAIDDGKIKYDLRMHEPNDNTTGEEEYNTQHDHGTGFRAKFENISSFYDEVNEI
ncbi:MAG: hypothetical protein HOD60_15225 [Candidatus Nitrosopelagicus sp.]|nr:hypothetical protein [Candidatus Nitrosopelagicus sp.]